MPNRWVPPNKEHEGLKMDVLAAICEVAKTERLPSGMEWADRRDFYTDGTLDLEKARSRGKLHLIKGFDSKINGEIISIQLHNDVSGFVYLIRAANGLVKIGRAHSAEKRLVALRSMSPVSVILVGAWFTTQSYKLERELHLAFAAKRDHGEWFALNERDIESIRRMLEVNGDEQVDI